MPATAIASWVRAIQRALIDAGCDADPLLRRAGLDPALLDDPEARYPVAGTTQLWAEAVAATGDEAFGLRVARSVTPTTFHALGYSSVASPTLAAAFERAARYLHVVTDAAAVDFQRVNGIYHFRVRMPPHSQLAMEAQDAFAAVMVRLCRGLAGRGCSPLGVELPRGAPMDASPFTRLFRCPIRFDAPALLLIYDAAAMEQSLLGGNPVLAAHSDRMAEDYAARLQQAGIVQRLRAWLQRELAEGSVDEQAAAEALHMSRRSLQRHLAAEGMTFRALLAQVRLDAARSAVEEGNQPLAHIAEALGFSELSSFSRAYKRWTGESPAAARRRRRLGSGTPRQ